MTLPAEALKGLESQSKSITWKVDGMDCGSCASTIRTALEKLPGVSDIKISVTKETLSLALAEGTTTADAIEARVKRLGFGPTLQAAKAKPAEVRSHDHAGHDHHAHEHGKHDHSACGHDHDAHDHKAHSHAPVQAAVDECGCGHDHAAPAPKPIEQHAHDHSACGHDHDAHDHGAHDHAPAQAAADECGCGHDHAVPAPKPAEQHAHDHSACGHEHDHDHHHGHDHAHPAGAAHAHASANRAAEVVAADALSWKVAGMDCGSCAATIRTALEKMPGVSDLKISITNETLSLRLAAGSAGVSAIDTQLSRLGYKPTLLTVPSTVSEAVPVAPPEAPRRWWATSKGRVAIAAGLLLAAAYAVGLVFPQAAFAVFALATVIAVAPIAKRAVMAALAGAPFTIEMLMTIAAAGALFIGAIEEAAVVVFLFAVGEVLEGVAANKARSGIRALAALVPKTALLDEGGSVREVAAASLRIGQIALVRPGDRVPADGSVVAGFSSVDESPITGESVPKGKEPGAAIFAGSINQEAALRIKVERAPEDNTIARIVALVEEAQDAKAPTERFIDRFSRIYMPCIVGLSLLVAVLPPLFAGAEWSVWIYRGLTLLLIGCPCALVISVPAAIASSLSMAARRGLLVKGGAVVEALARTQIVAFDKTGTLTWGRPVVTDIVPGAANAGRLLALAGAVERESSHPLAEAIVARAQDDRAAKLVVSATRAIPGKGMEALLGETPIFIGAPRFATERAALPTEMNERIAALEAQGKTVVVVLEGETVAGLIALRDEPRPDARAAIAELKTLGLRAVMLTGDNRRTGEAIGGQLGIEVQAEMMPEAKVEAVRALRQAGHVVMVGDGINDAPALAAADAGIAMGSGTDVAIEAADAALLKSRVGDVVRLIRLSRATMANIRQNIVIALGLKLLFLVTTIIGATGLWIAVLADTGATVLVTLNALRLLGFFKGEDSPQTAAPETRNFSPEHA
ncbi:heavy metal translocating P-type ATPase [Bosea sp. 685]|uniref:heavy metal translocating P-type ATPase n=1 Tax=Bosea sp. 685 TaxID=3080057 RepID=UPI0028933AB8|nr:heavy metal translocating P-type ATPase [Bosea sp. 685]WNJ90148.1 heavy metal translocating P-type ATPase [Bosea sp. 685]